MYDMTEIQEYRTDYFLKKRRAASARAWNKAHPKTAADRANASHKKYRDEYNTKRREEHKADPRKGMFARARERASKKGVPFELGSYHEITWVDNCPCCGIKMECGVNKRQPQSPSLDRLKPELGYVPGNIAIICDRCNSIKNDANPTELRRIADWIEKSGTAA